MGRRVSYQDFCFDWRGSRGRLVDRSRIQFIQLVEILLRLGI